MAMLAFWVAMLARYVAQQIQSHPFFEVTTLKYIATHFLKLKYIATHFLK
jgi:hypothetical protein